MHNTEQEEKTQKMANIPEELPILPLRNTVAFPYSVMPLAVEGWSSIHTVISEESFWEIIDKLKETGAQGILIVPIEKMII